MIKHILKNCACWGSLNIIKYLQRKYKFSVKSGLKVSWDIYIRLLQYKPASKTREIVEYILYVQCANFSSRNKDVMKVLLEEGYASLSLYFLKKHVKLNDLSTYLDDRHQALLHRISEEVGE